MTTDAGASPRFRRAGGTAAALAVAAGTWAGAAIAWEVPWWLVVPVAGGALVGLGRDRHGVGTRSGRRRRAAAVLGVIVAAGMAGSALAAEAWRGLDAPVPASLSGRAELVGDPRPSSWGVRVEARSDGRLWDLVASGSAEGVLRGMRAGESVEIFARTRRRDPDDRWRASRHVVGSATVEAASAPRAATGIAGAANAVHRALLESTSHLPRHARGVALGVAIGDRGALDPLLAEDLRAAGLSHLTAVSGQHVALLLAMTSPLLGRLSPRWTVLATGALLIAFVVLTRAEPSVLRAVAMATVVVVSRAGGRHPVGLRVLAIVVAVLILLDPLLVWSVGFQLSVAATAGIAVGAGRITELLPGPRPLAGVLGLSVAAQLAVAPLVVAYFGVMPAVGLAANLVVVPVIAPLMGWTLVAGVLGSAVPALATPLHVPTGILAGWVAAVAQWCASLPVAGLDVWSLVAVGGCVGLVAAGSMWGRRWLGAVGGLMAISIVILSAGGDGGAPGGRHPLGTGAEVVVGGGEAVVIVDGRAQSAVVVGGLRRLRITGVTTVVVRSPASSATSVAELLGSRLGPTTVVAPAESTLADAIVPNRPMVLTAGPWSVSVRADGDERLDVAVIGPV